MSSIVLIIALIRFTCAIPTIHVTSPTSQIFKSHEIVPINWTYSDMPIEDPLFRIELWKNVSKLMTIFSSKKHVNSGYLWRVDDDLISGRDYKIRIVVVEHILFYNQSEEFEIIQFPVEFPVWALVVPLVFGSVIWTVILCCCIVCCCGVTCCCVINEKDDKFANCLIIPLYACIICWKYCCYKDQKYIELH